MHNYSSSRSSSFSIPVPLIFCLPCLSHLPIPYSSPVLSFLFSYLSPSRPLLLTQLLSLLPHLPFSISPPQSPSSSPTFHLSPFHSYSPTSSIIPSLSVFLSVSLPNTHPVCGCCSWQLRRAWRSVTTAVTPGTG